LPREAAEGVVVITKETLVRLSLGAAVLAACCGSAGCAPKIPKDALILKEPTTEVRARQSRRYPTDDEKAVLIASNQLLQDLGFGLDESNRDVGLLVASKDRTAVDGGQVAGQVAAAILLGVYIPIDKDQKIRASVVTSPAVAGEGIVVRVTFQRLVWDDRGILSRVERLDDPEMYTEFFDKLSKALFLEAQEVG
jgi:hypothetical protein